MAKRTDGTQFEAYGRCVITSVSKEWINFESLDSVIDPVLGHEWARPASHPDGPLRGSISAKKGWDFQISAGMISEVELMPLGTKVEWFITGKTLGVGTIALYGKSEREKPYGVLVSEDGEDVVKYFHEFSIRKITKN